MSRAQECARFESLHDRLLADEGPLDEHDAAFFKLHPTRCRRCAAEQNAVGAIQQLGQDPDAAALTEDELDQRVEGLLAVYEERPRPATNDREAAPAGSWGWAAGIGMAAALLVVAMGVTLWLSRTPTTRPRESTAGAAVAGTTLVAIHGAVRVSGRPAAVGATLYSGDLITVGTAGSARLRFADGSVAALAPNTRLRLSVTAAGPRVGLDAGEASFSIAPQRAPKSFVVLPPWGRVEVVGTIFSVAAGAEQVQVAKGAVRVRRPKRPAVLLRTNTELSAKGAPRPLAVRARQRLLARLRTPAVPVAVKVSHRRPTTARAAAPDTGTSTAQEPAARDPRPTRPVAVRRAALPAARPVTAAAPARPIGAIAQLLKQAAAQRRSRQWGAAVTTYRLLIARHRGAPEAATALVLMGQVKLYQLGQSTAALRDFGRYLSRAPRGALAPEALWGQAQANRMLGRRAAELAACRRLVSQAPASLYARHARKRLLALAGTPK